MNKRNARTDDEERTNERSKVLLCFQKSIKKREEKIHLYSYSLSEQPRRRCRQTSRVDNYYYSSSLSSLSRSLDLDSISVLLPQSQSFVAIYPSLAFAGGPHPIPSHSNSSPSPDQDRNSCGNCLFQDLLLILFASFFVSSPPN